MYSTGAWDFFISVLCWKLILNYILNRNELQLQKLNSISLYITSPNIYPRTLASAEQHIFRSGSEDIRADERYRPTRRSVFPELSSTYPYTKSIFDDPIHAAERITVPGYRYLPVHREVYGYSPRPIYAHNYPSSLDRYRPSMYNSHIL